MHITNLKVAFKKTVQPRDYESESAEVELSIALDENEAIDLDEVVGEALSDAKDQVFIALGKAPKSKDRTR